GVYYSQTIGETAQIMRDSQVGAVLVVDDGALSGVVTDRDLVVRGLAAGAGPDSPVGPLCSGELVGVAAGADVEQAGRLMREHAVRRLPVITDGQVVGIVSIGDLAVSADVDSPLAAVSRAKPNT
ncbi:MAG: CBS domain-containing protein, partial [Trebonia sp.]